LHSAGIQSTHTPLSGVVLTNLLTRGFAGSGTNLAWISCTTALAYGAYNPANKPAAIANAANNFCEEDDFIVG
jgi:hypothetical protein